MASSGELDPSEQELRRTLSPDELISEGLAPVVKPKSPPRSLLIDCADGHTRRVELQPHSHLVARSVVVDTRGLSDTQYRGLGLPPGYQGPVGSDFLDAEPPFGDPL